MIPDDLHQVISRKPSEELKKVIEKDNSVVYVFVNPIEYHGPHLGLYTDELLSKGMARLLDKNINHTPIWFDLPLGVDPAPGPGSVFTSYKDLKKSLNKFCRGLIRLNVKKVCFMTFHGAPLHNMAIHHAIKFLERFGIKSLSPFNFVLEQMLTFEAKNYQELLKFLPSNQAHEILEGLHEDYHGGLFETSLSLFLCPDNVSENYKNIQPCQKVTPFAPFKLASIIALKLGNKKLSKELEFAAHGVAWSKLRPHPGYTGTPHLASKEIGEWFVKNKLLPMYENGIQNILFGDLKPQKPILSWTSKLTLEGLIPSSL